MNVRLKYFAYKTLLFLHLGGKRENVRTKLSRCRAQLTRMKNPDYRLVAKSGFFDKKWYLARHPELVAGKADPIEHYLLSGWKDSDPSEKFSSSGYLEANEDVAGLRLNPLVHYLRYGKAEGRRCPRSRGDVKSGGEFVIEIEDGSKFFAEAKGAAKTTQKANPEENTSRVDVIIPVYNGLNHLENLLPELFDNTDGPHRFIFIDDKSPDPAVLPHLRERIAERSDCVLLTNEENLGFPATVNRAAAFSDSEFFVILNTDTRVPAGWLSRLCASLRENASVASATPFSNAATIFSFPFLCDDPRNRRFLDEVGIEKIDAALRAAARVPDEISAPTGVGFCMAIRKSAWISCGGFDAETFEKGYGEEVDWCQKTRARGMKHVLAPNLFVAHVHGGSFAADVKKRALERAAAIIRSRYPDYDREVAAHVATDPFAKCRAAGLLRLAETFPDAELFLAHALGGGADKYLKRRITKNLEHSAFGGAVLTWRGAAAKLELDVFFRGFRVRISGVDFSDWACSAFPRFKKIVVNELVSWPEKISGKPLLEFILRMRKNSASELTFLFHDFYALCPKITLTDETPRFCGVPENLDECSRCADGDMKKRRGEWRNFLSSCDQLIFFSENSLALAEKAFPKIRENAQITPHEPLHAFAGGYRVPGGKLLKIAVVGNINRQKGAQVVSDLAAWLKKTKNPAEIIVFGEFFGAEVFPNMTVLGRYAGDALQELLAAHGAQAALFPSICPETFSYVAQELAQIGIPVACFDLGASADRIRNCPKGKILRSFDPQRIFTDMEALFTKTVERQKS